MATLHTSNDGNGKASTQVVPWVSIVIALGAGFWAVANPRDDIKQMRLESAQNVLQIKTELQNEINIVVKDMKALLTKDEHREFVVRLDKDISRIEIWINDFQKAVVSRSEHMQHWAEFDDKHNALRQQVYDMRKEFIGTYNLGDQLKNLQKQIDDMRIASTIVHKRESGQ